MAISFYRHKLYRKHRQKTGYRKGETMKKFYALLLASVLFLSCFSLICAHAVTDELLINGDFEEGEIFPFAKYGPNSDVDVDPEYAHSGEYGASVSNRAGAWACWQQNVKDQIKECGPGTYRASVWVRLPEEESYPANCQLVLNYKQIGERNDSYLTSAKKDLTTGWQEFTIEKELTYDQEIGLDHVYVYVQVVGTGEEEAPAYYMDDFSLVKVSEVNGIKEEYALTHIDVSSAVRAENTTVGVIRWDAWYGRNNDTVKTESSILSQVEKTLSPAKYHFRAPFFARVTDEGNIEIPEYTQKIFDQEMQYAIDAGIDYFAFLMYDGDMKTAREFYKASAYNTDIKMCCIISPGQDKFRREIVSLFEEDYYMTVLNGRPLLYLYIDNDAQWAKVKDDIGYYRAECEKKGIKMPFVAIMSHSPEKVKDVYGDAAARYGVSVGNGAPFADIISKAKTMWEENRAVSNQFIPNVSFGWHTVPRFENPVSWMTVSENSYGQYATDEELYTFMKEALSYLQQEEIQAATKANTLTVYAWNEHDEGGWICPTIEVDENGNQLFHEDGTPKINTGHLDALKRAIAEYRESAGETAPPAGGGGAGAVTEQPPVDGGETKFPVLPVLCGGIVLIGVAVVILIFVKKRKEGTK